VAYISSNANRFYTAVEQSYGKVPAITPGNRFSAVQLNARQQVQTATRKDKTGSRTFAGQPQGGRRKTDFQVKTYLSTWVAGTDGPGQGPLFESAMGAEPLIYAGGTAGASQNANQIAFAGAPGLVVNQAVSYAGEIRFVSALVDANTVLLNAPFSAAPAAGSAMAPTVTYMLATELPSVSLFDYWSPSAALQRVLSGSVVDQLAIDVNGDFHEFTFKGSARDIVDSASFEPGDGELVTFPAEPALGTFAQSAVPGNLGQAWIGTTATKFLTLTEAALALNNDLDSTVREFGTSLPTSVSPGRRSVKLDFTVYEQTDSATTELYQAARQQSPIEVMLQLGMSQRQLCGVYLKNVTPVLPGFLDDQRRLQWQFKESRAQGTVDDELVVAFA
jgi:hypothetical protein